MSDAAIMRTTEGLEVRLRPVSRVLIQSVQRAVERELRAKGLPLDPPTYEVVTATGDKEVHAHDEDSISTDEERAAWEAYLAARETLQDEANARVAKTVVVGGVICDDPPDSWVEDMRYLGVELPEDPRDLKYAYLEMEILKTPADLMRAMAGVMRLSLEGAPKETIESIEALFRRALEGDAAPVPASEEGGVELQR
jgi:hypothetical protein